MRIISGTHKGRQIHPPKGLSLRPTTDIAKEALFNILNNVFDFEEVQVLDLFSGTGSISYEFASRGAAGITSVEKDLRSVDFIRETAKKLGFENLLAFRADAFRYLQHIDRQYDIIFCDPPFDLDGVVSLPSIVFERNLLRTDGWLIIEHSRQHKMSGLPGFFQHRNYGKVNFTIFKNPGELALPGGDAD